MILVEIYPNVASFSCSSHGVIAPWYRPTIALAATCALYSVLCPACMALMMSVLRFGSVESRSQASKEPRKLPKAKRVWALLLSFEGSKYNNKPVGVWWLSELSEYVVLSACDLTTTNATYDFLSRPLYGRL